MLFVGLKNCDTCRKARKALDDAGLTYEVVDVRADGLDRATIEEVIAGVGAAALNRASTTWRGLSETEKAGDPAALIAAHPTLLKRPAIRANGHWTVGWTPKVRDERLGNG